MAKMMNRSGTRRLQKTMMGNLMSPNPYDVRMDAPTMPRAAKQRGTGTTRGYRSKGM